MATRVIKMKKIKSWHEQDEFWKTVALERRKP